MSVRLDSECLGNNNSIAENDENLPFRDPLGHKSKVIQKLCCDKLCEVAVLKELVNGILERDFIKATDAEC